MKLETLKKHISMMELLTKYPFWVKKIFIKKRLRKFQHQKIFTTLEKNKKFKFSSFPTISGCGPNGAIIHYQATKKTNRTLRSGDIYLGRLRRAV